MIPDCTLFYKILSLQSLNQQVQKYSFFFFPKISKNFQKFPKKIQKKSKNFQKRFQIFKKSFLNYDLF